MTCADESTLQPSRISQRISIKKATKKATAHKLPSNGAMSNKDTAKRTPTKRFVTVKRMPTAPKRKYSTSQKSSADKNTSWQLILKDLNDMRSKGILCDVKFAGCDYPETKIHFKAHSALLAASSKVFCKLLVTESTLPSNAMIHMDDITTEKLQLIVDFIYGVIPNDICSDMAVRSKLQQAAVTLEVKSAQKYLQLSPIVVVTTEPSSMSPVMVPVGNKQILIQPRICHSAGGHEDVEFATPSITNEGIPPKRIYSNCFKCRRKFYVASELADHLYKAHAIELHRGSVIYKCKSCVQLFWHQDALTHHEKTCKSSHFHPMPNQIFSDFYCKLCNNIYFNEEALRAHIVKSHEKHSSKDDVNDVSSSDVVHNPSSTAETPETAIPMDEDARGDDEASLELVEVTKDDEVVKITDQLCDENISFVHEDEVDKESNVANEENTEEEISDGDNESMGDLDEDSEFDESSENDVLIPGDGDRTCFKCDIVFDSSYELQSHQTRIHKYTHKSNTPNEDGTYTCGFCGHTLENRQQLTRHRLQQHSKAQKCTFCVEHFDSSFKLIVHMYYAHHGREYYACCMCGKMYNSFKYVLNHFAQIHNIDAVYPLLRGLKAVINPMNMPKVGPLYEAVKQSSVTEVCEWGRTWLDMHYTCPHCHVSHRTAAELAADVKRHLIEDRTLLLQLDQRMHECQKCGMLHNTREELDKHLTETHGECLTCTYCNDKFTDYRTYLRHIKTYDAIEGKCHKLPEKRHSHRYTKMLPRKTVGRRESLKCLPCKENFLNNAFLLLMHNVKHHGLKWKMCSICGKSIQSAACLVNHMKIHDIDVNYPQLKALKLVLTASNIENITPMYTALMNSAENNVTEWANKWLKKNYLCTYCNLPCPSARALVTHIKDHLIQDREMFSMVVGGLHECELCRETFQSAKLLGKHKLSEHSTGHECNICERKFFTEQALTSHIKLHNAPFAFQCEMCSKSFRSRSHLADHILTHTNVRKYACVVCGMKFKLKTTLNAHFNRMHDANYEKRFKCKTCGSCFHTSGNLRAHEETHSDVCQYRCTECNATFKTKRIYRKHMHVHGIDAFMATAPPNGRPRSVVHVPADDMAAIAHDESDSTVTVFKDGRTVELFEVQYTI